MNVHFQMRPLKQSSLQENSYSVFGFITPPLVSFFPHKIFNKMVPLVYLYCIIDYITLQNIIAYFFLFLFFHRVNGFYSVVKSQSFSNMEKYQMKLNFYSRSLWVFFSMKFKISAIKFFSKLLILIAIIFTFVKQLQPK